MQYSLIANSGIQMFTFKLKLNLQDKFKMWFHEWYDTSNGQWRLDLVHEVITDETMMYYDKHELFDGGYLNDPRTEYDPTELKMMESHRCALMTKCMRESEVNYIN